ncbi:MAG: T9SS type A sorting domain-containing protein, partial [Bacteroidales bacterium]|nr:T9SS type A sorting domain-containing protein [Bacteroidales bacterium]
ITGPLNYDFDEWKIELRFENDVLPAIDLIPPAISIVNTVNDTIVKVEFTESVEEIGAETIENYIINNNIEVIEAKRHSLQYSTVFLTVSKMETSDYNITINNIEDLAGNAMENVQTDFTHQSSGINNLFSNADISIYPNPASGYFILNIPPLNNLDKELMLSINNLSGQTIIAKNYTIQKGGSYIEFNTSMIDKGMYIIKISSAGKTGVQKLIIK